ncbi:bifunctional 3,4-dihydroxy-2-butanone-4-phosphate synthase/GTP cyclohydrolase II [Cerasibacillus terrae]|uniref:Riboflavin biosynthesis protein RibBA n=1 Tax=Cerasibacillus terrae TaxID=2498845 RepID=A0A5C8NX96_9BACI|nr:bifunctional 3,4-dihydroxy-2-butanone-4-phosphate synthase/GTP cyclohydrolase II [Cerasibacillus terrae]TXL65795.1 bifunctional 3,4-dihydroxy-2-butanone-4-phosphate synthase/GTP cyclohydrolase II [Cerasibacillus terrae]
MFHTIEEALTDLKNGKPIIVVDDEDRENEGDLVALAEKTTPEMINFMITHGKGLVCTSITKNVAEKLDFPPMTYNNSDPLGTAFTISIDHQDTTTGISAYERSLTIQALLKKDTKAKDFKRPGHVFPLIAKENGVLTRPGHTEASVDLARLSGTFPAGVICEIIKDDGTMARLPELVKMSQALDIKLISIEHLIEYRKRHETHVKREVETVLPTKFGKFNITGYSNDLDEKEHIALVKGDVTGKQIPLVRMHSECLTGDVFGSKRCDCGPQLEKAMQSIETYGSGVIVYLRQEGRGIGLLNKLRAYKLQDEGLDTMEANKKLGFAPDLREYHVAAQILLDLDVKQVKLMTNNPEKMALIESYGIEVVERIPIETGICQENIHYLQTKKERFGHLLEMKG